MEAKIIPLHHQELIVNSLAAEASFMLPLFATTVPAGFPSPATDYSAEPIDLNRYLAQNPTSTFLARVQGDSMIGANIQDQDLAVVDRSMKVESGKIVMAYVDGEFTIKRLLIEQDNVYLVPENPKYKAIKIADLENLRIWGVVVGIARVL